MFKKLKKRLVDDFVNFTLVSCNYSWRNGLAFCIFDVDFEWMDWPRSLFSINTDFETFFNLDILFFRFEFDYD